jgi:hypothetical protein
MRGLRDAYHGALELEAEQVLKFGQILISVSKPVGETLEEERLRPFGGSEATMEKAWKQHRARLLAQCDPGTRCWAFYKFDLQIVDRDFQLANDFYAELSELIKAHLIDAVEAAQIDRSFCDPRFRPRSAPPDTSPYSVSAERLSAAEARAYSGIRSTLGALHAVQLLELQARWHGYRGRHAAAAEAWREADSKLVELLEASND